MKVADKRADLAGPGIGNYDELQKVLPDDYRSLLDVKETQRAIFAAKRLHRGESLQGTEPDDGYGSR